MRNKDFELLAPAGNLEKAAPMLCMWAEACLEPGHMPIISQKRSF